MNDQGMIATLLGALLWFLTTMTIILTDQMLVEATQVAKGL